MDASIQFYGPKPCLHIPYNITKRVIGGFTERESNTRWNKSTQYRQSKLFLKSYDKKNTRQLMSQRRTNIALVAGITTGLFLLDTGNTPNSKPP
ncbi:jg15851 [Pararge aegeria aegeria]|uniref:Jg15851 protein n=1 Tax=Pararge aegeria aegeria TaxID=348720 RepID=A0A8S4SLT6_9NEOP|nr:jg15851 [Pararge aegeria aegeria]